MKKVVKWLLYSFLLVGSQACGISVLDVELPSGEPRLVVEGTISNLDEPHTVLLNQSSSFSNNNSAFVDNALVIISSTNGVQDTLKNLGNGKYETQIEGIPGNTYQLDVLWEGRHYQAFSSMPSPAKVDSVSVKYHQESLVREEGYYASLHVLDAPYKEGYFRWIVWKNNKLHRVENIPGHFAALDLNMENSWLDLQYPTPFQLGDTLKVHTIKMDERVYTYYQGLYELMINDGGLMGPLPVNPETNISGNALGLFQAISIMEREIVIQ